jgi:hypothetical protein
MDVFLQQIDDAILRLKADVHFGVLLHEAGDGGREVEGVRNLIFSEELKSPSWE